MPFTPQVRVLLIVLVLACAAAGAGLMVLGRAQDSTESSPAPITPTPAAPARPATPAKPSTAKAKPALGTSALRPATASPRVQPRAAAPKPVERDLLPLAIRRALSANRVVVVALFDPKAKIDDTAVREASAGAQLAGTTFVPVDVTKNEVDSLNARYGVIQDPAVLVLRPPGDLVVRIDGFADRDTVAQAAANAAS
jgi:hypothetical protein